MSTVFDPSQIYDLFFLSLLLHICMNNYASSTFSFVYSGLNAYNIKDDQLLLDDLFGGIISREVCFSNS